MDMPPSEAATSPQRVRVRVRDSLLLDEVFEERLHRSGEVEM